MYHTVIVVGYLGGDPEMRYIPSGTPVTNFSLATSTKYTSASNELIEETVWFRVSVFGKQAESSNTYLKKGSLVLIEGRLKPDPKTGAPRTFTKKDGSAGASYELTAQNVKFLTSAKSSIGSDIDTSTAIHEGEEGDSIPF